jgi:5'-nucleotidase
VLILLCNDDGIASTGIRALHGAVADLGEVWVVAPDREQSATSHAISLDRPLRGVELQPRWVAVNGTPTDCVYLAVNHFLPHRPDLVLSGINKGPNTGDDVHYSGTVAAAKEASLLGVTAMALSLCARPPFEFSGAAAIARALTERLIAEPQPPGTLLNVNIPEGAGPDAPVRVTRLGKRRYTDAVERRLDPRGRPYFWIGGEDVGFAGLDGSDGAAVLAGMVSVTPLKLDLTDADAMARLKPWERG